ncbi:AAA family ATPase [Chryseobacterium sp. Marseille-Q3244]|uniref:AAA family ATPase n=1 Tax=Chryseobacterium sp. Marseille-Q3244 TaxID=2758092 RepID=UPI002023DE84|nr:AAA family ATPase [Chryseobacterium sp. Marseille-Q3244]
MKLLDLHLKNIGPFLDDTIEFATSENSKKQVTIITGENGTGKTIILDAIRGLFLGVNNYDSNLKRKITHESFSLTLSLLLDNNNTQLTSEQYNEYYKSSFNVNPVLSNKFSDNTKSKGNFWITNYWTSQNDNQSFNIASLDFIKPEDYLINSLSGIQKNAETTKIITFFDYYKSSDKLEQREEGEFIYNTIKRIFSVSLNRGELQYVDRTSLLPIININSTEISLDKLSNGNLYLIQRMLGLLSQMYSVYKLNNLPLYEMLETPGVLLIDEAENHLHPKWQKTFINSILEIFPNLQIIATTHSPFIVGSVEGAKVYVCEFHNNHSKIKTINTEYSNKPIDEILISDIFSTTQPFANEEIVSLLEIRKKAIKSKDKQLEKEIEKKLIKINPQYFSYLELDNLLNSIKE